MDGSAPHTISCVEEHGASYHVSFGVGSASCGVQMPFRSSTPSSRQEATFDHQYPICPLSSFIYDNLAAVSSLWLYG